MSLKSDLVLIKRDLRTLLRAGFSHDSSERMYSNVLSFCDPECSDMVDTTIYSPCKAFSVQYSYYENYCSMTIFFGRRNLQCTLLDFQNDGTVVIGKAMSTTDLSMYNSDVIPSYEDLNFINIDHETFLGFKQLKMVLKPYADQVYRNYFIN